MTDAIKLAIEAIKLARHSHGMALMSDPPQDAWKYHKVDEKLDAALAALRAHHDKQAQPEPVNAMLLEALEAAEKLEHTALVALSEATDELKVGNTYTTATDTYKAHNDLIHRLDKILNLQYRDRKREVRLAAQHQARRPAVTTKDQAIAQAINTFRSLREYLNSCTPTGWAAHAVLCGDALACLKEAQAQPPAPDCRTCAGFSGCISRPKFLCTNGDKYKPGAAVVLWRTE